MLELLNDIAPDLIILDIVMPEMDGFAAMRMLKANARHSAIPVMFLTSQNDAATETLGFDLGAVDFISKPFSESDLLNRIKTHLEIEGLIRERTEMLQLRTEKLQKLQDSMVAVLADMLESRDKTTAGHVERTTIYTKTLVSEMIRRGIYAEEMSGWDLDLIAFATRLHDIGKISVSDLILNKPGTLTVDEFDSIKAHAADGEQIIEKIIRGSLTADEFDSMKTHPEEGERILEKIMVKSGYDDFLHHAKLFAGYHHERWDGTGYPYGLKGAGIPLQGRIMAIVDVYDALISERPYKKALKKEAVLEIIMEDKGKAFDPKITQVFIEISGSLGEVESCR
jgi:putative two-component system response regulator